MGRAVRVSDRQLAAHALIVGASGAGKSTTMLAVLADQIGRGAPVVAIDRALGSPYWVAEPGKEAWECVMRGTAPDGKNLFVTKPGDPPMKTHHVLEAWLSATKPVPAAAAQAQSPAPPAPAADGKAFIAAFGETKGAKWFAEGIAFDAAKDLFIADLRTENETLAKRLTAVAGGEEQPVSFQPSEPDQRGGMTPALTQLANNQGDNIARIAAAIGAMSPGVFRQAR